jgi:hypothetical protein
MKARMVKDEGFAFLEERSLLLAETDTLLAETDRMSEKSRQLEMQREELSAESEKLQERSELSQEVSELRSAQERQASEFQRRNSELSEELKAAQAGRQSVHQGHDRSFSAYSTENDELREQSERLSKEVLSLTQTNRRLMEEQRDSEANARHLTEEVKQLQATVEELKAEREQLHRDVANAAKADPASPLPSEPGTSTWPVIPGGDGGGSEGRLRRVMTSTSVTSEELKQAIGAVEALVDEARRELERKELRERRAAFEQLGTAVEKADETMIAEALVAARRTAVPQDEIEKAEAKLEELRSMSDEQKQARVAREIEGKRKKEAFLLVKKDQPEELQDLIKGLDEKTRWKDWRDYAGRTLYKAAQELRSERVKPLLADLLGMKPPNDSAKVPAKRVSVTMDFVRQLSPEITSGGGGFGIRRISQDFGEGMLPAQLDKEAVGQEEDWWGTAAASNGVPTSTSPKNADIAPPEPGTLGQDSETIIVAGRKSTIVDLLGTKPTIPVPSEAEEAELKAKALKAVVRDDAETLIGVLEVAPRTMWENWQNKAGKDLLTLSQERGSTTAYSILAKALGILNELKRHTFEEREAVWIYIPGDVQPLPATVLEDTSEEPDEILVEFWDGDEPAKYVGRDQVFKRG